jgi:drug/metabolite transporter superfamily protein YnfA
MSEFEEYLGRIRAALDVRPRRAEEILSEVRSHLEARAAELERGGLPREQAAAEAIQSFGDPAELALSLRKANGRHRQLSAARVVLALGLSAAAMIIPVGALEIWYDPYRAALGRVINFDSALGCAAALVVSIGPFAPLAGLLAGRRGWWAPAVPPLGWSLLYWALAVTDRGTDWHNLGPDGVAALFLFPVLVAPLLAALGWIGTRSAGTGTGRAFIAIGSLWMLLQVVVGSASLRDPVGILATIGITESVLLLAVLPVLWSHRPQTVPAVRWGAAALVLFVALMTLGHSVVFDRVFPAYQGLPAGWRMQIALWSFIVGGQAALLLWLGARARRFGQARGVHAA